MLTFVAKPSSKLHGRLRVPGDKSISHRAIMLGALADGDTEISGFLPGADCVATIKAFRAMGVSIEHPKPEQVMVHGVGLHGLQAPSEAVDLGNSGTAMRLLSGILAAQQFDSIVTGDASLNQRPMRRIVEPLSLMGARIETDKDNTAPLHIRGKQRLQGIDYTLPVASAQVKSCLLLAGLYAQDMTRISEPAPCRDHTERMLSGFGYEVQKNNNSVMIQGGRGQHLRSTKLDVPADISSAAFLLVAASIAEDADIYLENVGINPTRTGVITILNAMGADIELLNRRDSGGEPVADLRIKSTRLQGVRIPESLVPLAIDEFPALFVAAAIADGKTTLSDARELRVKESDRIQVMADGLTHLGATVEPTEDGIIIDGNKGKKFVGGTINSHGDHRIAMAFSAAAAAAEDTIIIRDCDNVATSYPSFVQQMRNVGLEISTW